MSSSERRSAAAAGNGRRSKGRPRAEGSKVGRDEIVRAATELLQETPLGKLTSAAVAKRVGAHPALINYYFKNRSELLVAVATELMRDLRAHTDFDTDPSAGAEQSLRKRLAGVIGFHRRYPFVHRLIVDEILNSPSPAARAAFEAMTDVGLAGYSAFLNRGVARGELRRVEPVFLYLATIGMCEFFNAGKSIVTYARAEADADEVAEAYLDFMMGLLLQGLAPRN